MDRVQRVRTKSPVYSRQKSVSSTASGATSPPMMSPVHRHARSGSTGVANFRKNQNYAAKAAAQRLAQVMAHQPADSDEDDDDDDDHLDFDFSTSSATPSIGLAPGRGTRPRSSAIGRNATEQPSSARSTSSSRSALAVKTVPMVPPTVPISLRQPSSTPTETPKDNRRESSRLPQVMAHQPADSDEDEDDDDNLDFDFSSSSAAPNIGLAPRRGTRPRSPAIGHNAIEQPSSARSTSSNRPAFGAKTVPMVPPTVPISLRPPSSTPSETPRDNRRETPRDARRDKRMSVDLGNFNVREFSNERSSSLLQDELDMLQEENENMLGKLRLAEERCEEAEARARQLEKQVASLGEGVSMEARLLNKKEAALRQREAALKTAGQTHGKNVKATSLQLEAGAARDEATSAIEQLHEAESEIKSLRTTAQRIILTKEEMEEVVLKRCWLARYWNLCVQHGIHPEIAGSRYEFWSSLSPLPLEVVLAAGQKAKEEYSVDEDVGEERDKILLDVNDLSGERSIESMLLVEKGLRELALLKVEDAIMLAMAQHRRPNLLKSGLVVADDLKIPIEGQKYIEAFELNKEEAEDMHFKQAWLIYIWRRAKNHGIEQDIVDERLQFWVNHGSRPPTSHDTVDVERGLLELKKLGIENQLWQATRKWIDPDGIYTRMQSNDI